MTGPSEEAGQTARSVVSALSSQPMTLALVVFNVCFLVVVYLGVRDQRNRQEDFQKQLFEQQTKTMEMLYHCVPPPHEQQQ